MYILYYEEKKMMYIIIAFKMIIYIYIVCILINTHVCLWVVNAIVTSLIPLLNRAGCWTNEYHGDRRV